MRKKHQLDVATKVSWIRRFEEWVHVNAASHYHEFLTIQCRYYVPITDKRLHDLLSFPVMEIIQG